MGIVRGRWYRPAAGFTTRRPEEPYANNARTVLWEPGRATAPATQSTGGGVSAVDPSSLSPELVDEAVDRAGGCRRVREALGVASDRWISDEVIDELLAGASSEEEIAGPGGLLSQLTKRLVERAMESS